jgi:hypothetical protein
LSPSAVTPAFVLMTMASLLDVMIGIAIRGGTAIENLEHVR